MSTTPAVEALKARLEVEEARIKRLRVARAANTYDLEQALAEAARLRRWRKERGETLLGGGGVR